uniref:Receptor ligand binding region domain-containing protein n=1 Tax=Meloidogyne incognita TaxID=6306 RepID=A0A914NHB6_MELIC
MSGKFNYLLVASSKVASPKVASSKVGPQVSGPQKSYPHVSRHGEKNIKNRIRTDNPILLFSFTWKICDCDQVLAAGYVNELILNTSVDVIIGPPCVTSAIVAGFVPAFYNIPIYLWGATMASALNDQTVYPTLVNINSNTKMLSLAIQAVLAQFNWFEISLIYVPDNVRKMSLFFPQDFETVISNNSNFTIVYRQQMDSTAKSMKDTLLQLQNRSRSWN